MAGLYISQLKGRKVARSIHLAGVFSQVGVGVSTAAKTTTVDTNSAQNEPVANSASQFGADSGSGRSESIENPLGEASLSQLVSDRKSMSKVQQNKLGLTEDDMEELQEIFSSFDDDDSGFLTHQELLTKLEQGHGVRISENAMESFIEKIDKDCDGSISFFEFVHVMVLFGRQREADGASQLHASIATAAYTGIISPCPVVVKVDCARAHHCCVHLTEELTEAFKLFTEPEGDHGTKVILKRNRMYGVFKSSLPVGISRNEFDTQVVQDLETAIKDEDGEVTLSAFKRILHRVRDPVTYEWLDV